MIRNQRTLNLGILCGMSTTLSFSQQSKPNIVLILVDDMGYSDIGCYGGEIPTPNIDQLAANGVRFKQFYNTSRSCPTRASLLTGLYQHQTGVGMMSTESGASFDFGVEGYRGFLNKNCVTIAEVLKESGYHTYMTGKWHLGSDVHEKRPLQRGFDRFYGNYNGAFSYFDPKGDRPLVDHDSIIRAPKGFYSTDMFTEKAIEFIKSGKDDKPFFLYLAYNAPHWPLHAKDEDIQKFIGKYMAGWDNLRQQRLKRQIKMGLFDKSVKLTPRDERVRSWELVSQDQKVKSDYRMAVYAAQIYAVDYNIGKLVEYLKKTKQLNNTLIMFLSDNGACGEPYTEFGGGQQSEINNPDKWGSISYGLGWANLSNTPYKLYKNNASEGGIRTPFIAHWPKKIKKYKAEFIDAKGHLINIMPTIIEVSGATYPSSYHGKKILPLEGKSLLTTFLTGKPVKDDYLFFEHSYNRAVIKGDWKAVSRIGTDSWFLYHLKNDITEQNNVADQYPEIVTDMAARWEEWAIRSNALPKGKKSKNSYD